MRTTLIFIFFIFNSQLIAEEINFSNAVNVTAFKKGLYHHLDTSGRKSIAANKQGIAVAWEDNRNGNPQAYVAFKNHQQKNFSKTIRLSIKHSEAYEPAVIAITKHHFLFAWEQNQQVWLSTGNAQQVSKAVLADKQASSQVSLSMSPGGKVFACWIQHRKPHHQLVVSEINITGTQPVIGKPVIVDTSYSPRRQSYPSISTTRNGIAVAWEDREHGHTRIYTSFSIDGKQFTPKQVLNDFVPPQNTIYGRGTGATRVALGSDGENTVVASWMDKRDFLGGYDIYAAVSRDAGNTYGKNEIVQDMLGENQPQWHPAVTVNQQGKIYVAWDDPRDDTADIWLSHRLPTEWSEDQLVEPASGKGRQNNPSITFDPSGRLHIVWIEQEVDGTKLRYATQQ